MKCWYREYKEGQCHITDRGIEKEVFTATLWSRRVCVTIFYLGSITFVSHSCLFTQATVQELSRDSNMLCCTSWNTICIMHPLGSLVSSELPNRFPTCCGSFLFNKGQPIITVLPQHVNLLLLHFLSKFGPSFILVDGFRNNRATFGRLDAVTSVLIKIQFKYSEIWRRIDWQIITSFFSGGDCSLHLQSLYSKDCYKTDRIPW